MGKQFWDGDRVAVTYVASVCLLGFFSDFLHAKNRRGENFTHLHVCILRTRQKSLFWAILQLFLLP